MTKEESWELLNRDFPVAVREELLRGAATIYPAAFEAAEQFTDHTGRWMQPLFRHGLMRDTLAAIGARFPDITVSVPKTNPPTTDYVQLSRGGSVLTIATSISEPEEMPRWAKHRASKAASFNYDLFEAVPDATGVYAILLCGPDVTFGNVKHAPAFIDLGIPASDYEMYFNYHPLYEEFPGVVGEVLGVSPSEIESAYVQMRLFKKDMGGEAG